MRPTRLSYFAINILETVEYPRHIDSVARLPPEVVSSRAGELIVSERLLLRLLVRLLVRLLLRLLVLLLRLLVRLLVRLLLLQ